MKKLLSIVPILIIVLASLQAKAQSANQSNANTPLISPNQSNINTPLINNLSTSTAQSNTIEASTFTALTISVNMPLDEIFSSGAGDASLQSIINTIGTYSGQEQQAMKSLRPDTSGSNTQAVQAVSDAALGTVESHLESGFANNDSTSS
jgi:hypothetical protein